MKLLKLVYLSHGWYLAFYDRPLISEAVLAWRYGPVIKSVYIKFKFYGKCQIESLADIDGDGVISNTEVMPSDPAICRFLDQVWERYSQYNGLQLSDLTHQDGSPWSNTKNRNGEGAIISTDSIKEYYRQILNTDGTTVQPTTT